MFARVFLFCCLLAIASAAKNTAFCKQNQDPNVDITGTGIVIPAFPDEFGIVLEQTNPSTRTVMTIEEDYSQSKNAMYMETKIGGNKRKTWIDVKKDRDLELKTVDYDKLDCTYTPLNQSSIRKFFQIMRDSTGKEGIVPPQVALHVVMPDSSPRYIGEGTTRAGIKTYRWQMCQYMQDSDTTALVTVHFAAPNVTMPMQKQMILAADVKATTTNAKLTQKTGKNFSYRYDYVNAVPLDDTNRLVPQPGTYCINEPMANNLPKMPSSFSFKGEEINFGEPGRSNPDVTITNIQAEYDASTDMLLSDRLTDSFENYGLYTRRINDYKLGIAFRIDVDRGVCVLEPLDKATDTSLLLNASVTNMKDPQKFFLLDRPYQYLGQRYHAKRGIDCDVWAAREEERETIWYFATSKWLKHTMGYSGQMVPMPVSVEVTDTENQRVINFYDFSPELFDSRPDYSSCFDDSDKITVLVGVAGGSYKNVYRGHAFQFSKSFRLAIAKAGKFETTSRIANMKIFPNKAGSVMIYFDLLGKPNITGVNPLKVAYPSVTDILSNLTKAGSVGFNVTDESGTLVSSLRTTWIAPSKNSKKTTVAPKGTTNAGDRKTTHTGDRKTTHTGDRRSTHTGDRKTTHTGDRKTTHTGDRKTTHTGDRKTTHTGDRKTTHTGDRKTTHTGDRKTTHTGKTRTTHTGDRKTTHTGDRKTTPRTREGSGKSKGGYSGGEMAGLAIGTILLGVLLTLVGVFLYTRYISPRFFSRQGDIGVMELQEHS